MRSSVYPCYEFLQAAGIREAFTSLVTNACLTLLFVLPLKSLHSISCFGWISERRVLAIAFGASVCALHGDSWD